MSLINDALKKAQRQRAEEASALPLMLGNSRISNGKPGNQTIILLGAGAVALITVSVVFTVHFLSNTNSQKTTLPPSALSKSATQPTSQIAVTSEVTTRKVAVFPIPPAQVMIPSTKQLIEPPNAPSAPVILTQSLRTDEEIQTMVDKFKVSGVRSGGSKVLMNDHIVRVNEVVDRETGLRLVRIEDDMLIFKDGKGTLYTKNF